MMKGGCVAWVCPFANALVREMVGVAAEGKQRVGGGEVTARSESSQARGLQGGQRHL